MTVKDIQHPDYCEERLESIVKLGKEAPVWLAELQVGAPCYAECGKNECRKNTDWSIATPINELLTRLNILADLGVKKLIIGGPGDPVNHPQIYQLISYAYDLGIRNIALKSPFQIEMKVAEDLINCGVNELRIKMPTGGLTSSVINILLSNLRIDTYLRSYVPLGYKASSSLLKLCKSYIEGFKIKDIFLVMQDLTQITKPDFAKMVDFLPNFKFSSNYYTEFGDVRVNDDSPTYCPVIADSLVVNNHGMIHECPAHKYGNSSVYADIYEPNLRQKMFRHASNFDPTEDHVCRKYCSLANVVFNKMYKER